MHEVMQCLKSVHCRFATGTVHKVHCSARTNSPKFSGLGMKVRGGQAYWPAGAHLLTDPPPPPALVCAELTEAPLSLEGKHSGACVYELVLMGYRVFSGRGRCYAEGWGGCVAAACKLFGCSVLPAGRRCTVWEWECWSIFQVRSANISW